MFRPRTERETIAPPAERQTRQFADAGEPTALERAAWDWLWRRLLTPREEAAHDETPDERD